MDTSKLQGATHHSYDTDWEKKAREYAAKKTSEKEDGKMDESKNTNDNKNAETTQDEAEDNEIKIELLKNQLVGCPMNFVLMEKLIKLLANMPDKENELADAYKLLLNEFPLCFGYWKRLAKMYIDKEQYDRAESIYQSGLKYLFQNPQYYLSYLKCVTENPKNSLEVIRGVMDQAIKDAGLHWKAYQLWTFIIDFEEKIFKNFSDETSEKQKQICFEKLKNLYFRFLSTPLEESNKSWEKFKNFINGGMDKGTNSTSNAFFFDFFDLLSDEEIIKLLDKLHEKASGSLRKRKLNEKNAAVTLNSTDETCPMIKIKYMDGKECIWVQDSKNKNNKLKDVLIFACENANNKRTCNYSEKQFSSDNFYGACLAYQNKLIAKNDQELSKNIDELFHFSFQKNMIELFFFEGRPSIKKKAESLGSQNAVENLCMEIREDLQQKKIIEFNKRLPYEQKVARWFYHPDALKAEQLAAWRDYLDFEESQGNTKRIKMLYKRVLEVCCNYIEFWRRIISKFVEQKNIKKAEYLYHTACYHLLKRRPDMYFEYAEFAESQGNMNLATDLLNKVINVQTGIAPGMVEGWIRMIALKRRMNDYTECKNLFLLAEKNFENKSKCLALLAMEKSNFLQMNFNDTEGAIATLRNEWEKQQDNFLLFKFFINFCENRAKSENKEDNYKLMCSIFHQALTDSQMTLFEQFKTWQSFCLYIQRNAFSIKDIIHVKNQAEKFLYEKRSELSEINNEELRVLSTNKVNSAMLHSQQLQLHCPSSEFFYIPPCLRKKKEFYSNFYATSLNYIYCFLIWAENNFFFFLSPSFCHSNRYTSAFYFNNSSTLLDKINYVSDYSNFKVFEIITEGEIVEVKDLQRNVNEEYHNLGYIRRNIENLYFNEEAETEHSFAISCYNKSLKGSCRFFLYYDKNSNLNCIIKSNHNLELHEDYNANHTEKANQNKKVRNTNDEDDNNTHINHAGKNSFTINSVKNIKLHSRISDFEKLENKCCDISKSCSLSDKFENNTLIDYQSGIKKNKITIHKNCNKYLFLQSTNKNEVTQNQKKKIQYNKNEEIQEFRCCRTLKTLKYVSNTDIANICNKFDENDSISPSPYVHSKLNENKFIVDCFSVEDIFDCNVSVYLNSTQFLSTFGFSAFRESIQNAENFYNQFFFPYVNQKSSSENGINCDINNKYCRCPYNIRNDNISNNTEGSFKMPLLAPSLPSFRDNFSSSFFLFKGLQELGKSIEQYEIVKEWIFSVSHYLSLHRNIPYSSIFILLHFLASIKKTSSLWSWLFNKNNYCLRSYPSCFLSFTEEKSDFPSSSNSDFNLNSEFKQIDPLIILACFSLGVACKMQYIVPLYSFEDFFNLIPQTAKLLQFIYLYSSTSHVTASSNSEPYMNLQNNSIKLSFETSNVCSTSVSLKEEKAKTEHTVSSMNHFNFIQNTNKINDKENERKVEKVEIKKQNSIKGKDDFVNKKNGNKFISTNMTFDTDSDVLENGATIPIDANSYSKISDIKISKEMLSLFLPSLSITKENIYQYVYTAIRNERAEHKIFSAFWPDSLRIPTAYLYLNWLVAALGINPNADDSMHYILKKMYDCDRNNNYPNSFANHSTNLYTNRESLKKNYNESDKNDSKIVKKKTEQNFVESKSSQPPAKKQKRTLKHGNREEISNCFPEFYNVNERTEKKFVNHHLNDSSPYIYVSNYHIKNDSAYRKTPPSVSNFYQDCKTLEYSCTSSSSNSLSFMNDSNLNGSLTTEPSLNESTKSIFMPSSPVFPLSPCGKHFEACLLDHLLELLTCKSCLPSSLASLHPFQKSNSQGFEFMCLSPILIAVCLLKAYLRVFHFDPEVEKLLDCFIGDSNICKKAEIYIPYVYSVIKFFSSFSHTPYSSLLFSQHNFNISTKLFPEYSKLIIISSRHFSIFAKKTNQYLNKNNELISFHSFSTLPSVNQKINNKNQKIELFKVNLLPSSTSNETQSQQLHQKNVSENIQNKENQVKSFLDSHSFEKSKILFYMKFAAKNNNSIRVTSNNTLEMSGNNSVMKESCNIDLSLMFKSKPPADCGINNLTLFCHKLHNSPSSFTGKIEGNKFITDKSVKNDNKRNYKSNNQNNSNNNDTANTSCQNLSYNSRNYVKKYYQKNSKKRKDVSEIEQNTIKYKDNLFGKKLEKTKRKLNKQQKNKKGKKILKKELKTYNITISEIKKRIPETIEKNDEDNKKTINKNNDTHKCEGNKKINCQKYRIAKTKKVCNSN